MKIKKIFIFLIASANLMFGQIGVKNTFKLAYEASNSSTVNNIFLGNGIIDLLVNNDEVWAATGYGLNKTLNEGIDWQTFDSDAYNSKGGISALAAMDSNTIWMATAFDTSAQDEDLSAGGGLSYTQDGGLTWIHDWKLQG